VFESVIDKHPAVHTAHLSFWTPWVVLFRFFSLIVPSLILVLCPLVSLDASFVDHANDPNV
jgi:hypothetical protein